MRRTASVSLRELLSGGDRRSVARSPRARALIENARSASPSSSTSSGGDDWLIAMRAIDLLEKLAHDHPDCVQTHKRVFIGPLATA